MAELYHGITVYYSWQRATECYIYSYVNKDNRNKQNMNEDNMHKQKRAITQINRRDNIVVVVLLRKMAPRGRYWSNENYI